MTARRRRDPRLPGPALEDVETVVGGERVASHGLSQVDRVIAAAHQDALDQVRYMWGIDRDDWLIAADEIAREHPDLAVVVLRKWCDIAVQARVHDSRAPESWGFFKLAAIYRKQQDFTAEIRVLEEWLSHWPPEREPPTSDRNRALRMTETARASARKGRM